MSNSNGFFAAVSSAMVLEKRLEVLTNNLSNIGTMGYKQDVMSFKSFLNEAEKAKGLPALVAVSEMMTDFSQGNLEKTGNPLDIGINGEGFFEVLTEDGTRYTRQGSFSLNENNQLVTRSGDPVSGEGGPLNLDGSNITVGNNGEITVDGASVGQIKLVHFQDMQQLKKIGQGLYEHMGDQSNLTDEFSFSMEQGFIEYSNVKQLTDMIQLIEISRAYEAAQKTIQSIDEATKKLVNEAGRL